MADGGSAPIPQRRGLFMTRDRQQTNAPLPSSTTTPGSSTSPGPSPGTNGGSVNSSSGATKLEPPPLSVIAAMLPPPTTVAPLPPGMQINTGTPTSAASSSSSSSSATSSSALSSSPPQMGVMTSQPNGNSTGSAAAVQGDSSAKESADGGSEQQGGSSRHPQFVRTQSLLPKGLSQTLMDAASSSSHLSGRILSTSAKSALQGATLRGVSAQSSRDATPLEIIEMALLELLALHKFSFENIWEGEPGLFPILYQFKEQFFSISSSDKSAKPLLVLNFPESATLPQKRFRVQSSWTVQKVLNLVCQKFPALSGSELGLFCIKGFRLINNEPLASFGFGTLFQSWELHVQVLPQHDKLPASFSPPVRSLLSPTPSLMGSSRMASPGEATTTVATTTPTATVSSPTSTQTPSPQEHDTHARPQAVQTITFDLPPLLLLGGLQKKTVRITPEQLHEPIRNIIKSVCSKFEIPNSEDFSLVTTDPSEAILLSSDATLESYGLGWKFNTWNLVIAFTSLCEIGSTVQGGAQIQPSLKGEWRWVDVSRANLVIPEAKILIRYLDTTVSQQSEIITQQLNDYATLEENLSNSMASCDLLEVEKAQLIDERDQLTAEKSQFAAMLVEKEATIDVMQSNVTSLHEQLQAQQRAADEKAEQALDAYNHLAAEKSAEISEVRASRDALESELARARAQIAETNNKLAQMTTERDDLEKVWITTKQEAAGLRDELSKTKNEFAEFQIQHTEAMESSKKRIEKLKAKLAESQKLEEEAQIEKKNLSAQLTQNSNAHTHTVKQFEERVASLQKEISELNQNLVAANSSEAAAKEQIQELTDNMQRLSAQQQQEQQEHRHQIDVLEHSISSLQENAEVMRQRHAEEIDLLRKTQEDEAAQHQASTQKLVAQLALLSEQSGEMRQQAEQKLVQLSQMNEEIEVKRKQDELALKRNVTKLEHDLSDSNSQYSKLQLQFSQSQAEIKALKERIEEQENMHTATAKKLQTKIASLTTEVATAKEKWRTTISLGNQKAKQLLSLNARLLQQAEQEKKRFQEESKVSSKRAQRVRELESQVETLNSQLESHKLQVETLTQCGLQTGKMQETLSAELAQTKETFTREVALLQKSVQSLEEQLKESQSHSSETQSLLTSKDELLRSTQAAVEEEQRKGVKAQNTISKLTNQIKALEDQLADTTRGRAHTHLDILTPAAAALVANTSTSPELPPALPTQVSSAPPAPPPPKPAAAPPVPPPPPNAGGFKAAKPTASTSTNLIAQINAQKQQLMKRQPEEKKSKTDPSQIHSVAELLYVSLHKKFQSVHENGEAEDLDDVTDDFV
ncbi:hypothetical protein Pelo_7711 [Pelomyxa schiedti]|nr:hypothetical protein Pelo_7711 [Pelomyxa schiedti]